ncbi:SH3 domain-containing protein [Niallia sp. 01092]|uniref:SH3 domain-containing protein n=1 Tax=unclassified Niallia TaxID=2837522 RepID=UPI003FD5632A
MKKVVIPGVFLTALSAPFLVHEVHADSIKGKEIKKYVNVDKNSTLHVRKGPSTSTEIITNLKNGDEVFVTTETNGWAKISINGKTGYVASNYLRTTRSTENQQTAKSVKTAPVKPKIKYVNVNKGSSLNLRTKPSENSSIIVKLAKGVSVTVYSEANGWAKVKVYGKEGYVSSNYLANSKTSTADSTPIKQSSSNKTEIKYVNVVGKSSLNLRSSGTTTSEILAKLTRGMKVEVYSQSNGWAKIKVNNRVGYVSADFLTTAKINNDSSSNAGNENSLEDKKEKKIATKYVNVSKNSSLNVRKEPSTSAAIMKKLSNKTKVDVLSEANGWTKINVENAIGYVSTSFLTNKKANSDLNNNTNINQAAESNNSQNTDVNTITKYVNIYKGSSLNMREKPSTSGKIINKLESGVVVIVYSEEDGWAKVSVNGKLGYVSAQYISEGSEKNPEPSNKTVNTIYQHYDMTLEDMTTIQMGVNPQTDKKYNTYIREDGLVFKTADATKGTVIGNGWRLRGGAGTEYWVTNNVKSGDQLNVVAKVKGSDGYYWYQVKNNQSWVSASKEDTSYYINPQNFVANNIHAMQFLKLSEAAKIHEEEVNENILAGKGILSGKASSFVTAANAYGINEIYLISHALLETGNGTSTLASGVSYNGKTVYNMYGIGAYDGNAITSGAEYAYNSGWFTPEAAIIGGAKFIAQGYINSGQDTLYKMRWNPTAAVNKGVATHQYASDIGWATKQVNQIYNLYNLLNSYTINVEVPVYK